MKNLVKMTRAEYTAAVANRTLVCPNVALITNEARKVEYLYSYATADIGIAAYEGGVVKYYSVEQWEALDVKPTVMGVYVFFAGRARIIHNDILTATLWAQPDIPVPGCFLSRSQAAALLDMEGWVNTAAVNAAYEGGTITALGIFAQVNAKTFADGGKGYLPAAGELDTLVLNQEAINAARLACGQAAINFATTIWSSSQEVGDRSWRWSSTSWTSGVKWQVFIGLVLRAL